MTRPRVHANRFRIWQHCQPLGWDVTMREVAEALGISVYAVRMASRAPGWAGRFRVSDNWNTAQRTACATREETRSVVRQVVK